MNPSLGRITARLAEPEEARPSGLIELLNLNIDPPSPLSENDVFIRAMYIVSDEVNSYGGRFPVEEHASMCELLVDSPVMVGHRKDKLPIGRTFHAVRIVRDGQNWIRSYFYWLKNAEGAANLRDNIDGGIYKECSVGFTFNLPECSICGKDIRLCPHEPFQTYPTDSGEVVCHFNYRQIERVLETSLVYRGAIPDTSVSRELKVSAPDRPTPVEPEPEELAKLTSPQELDADQQYLLIPRYECIPLTAEIRDGKLCLQKLDGEVINQAVADKFSIERLPDTMSASGRLVGYRGKERCRVDDLRTILDDGSGPVTRLVLYLLPTPGIKEPLIGDNKASYDLRTIAYRLAGREEIKRRAGEIVTRLGVEIRAVGSGEKGPRGYWYDPRQEGETQDTSNVLMWDDEKGTALLALNRDDQRVCFVIKQFNPVMLLKGRRLVADAKSANGPGDRGIGSSFHKAEIAQIALQQAGLVLELTGELSGEFVLRPIRLNGRLRYLFHRVAQRERS